MRSKKALREQLQTQTFFNPYPGTMHPPSGVADYPLLNSSGTSGSSSGGGAAIVGNPDGRKAMAEACAAFDKAASTLETRAEQEDTWADLKRDRANMGETFELLDAEANVLHVENMEAYLRRTHAEKVYKLDVDKKRCMAVMAKGVLEETRTYKALGEKVETRLGWAVSGYQQWNELVNCGVCLVQLHNMEKRYGFFKEDSVEIRMRAMARAGEEAKDCPPTLRKLFLNPAMETAGENPEKKKPKNRASEKSLEGFRRMTALALKDMQALLRQVPDEEPQMPSLPQNLTHYGLKVPETVPLPIREAIYAFTFIYDQYSDFVQDDLTKLRDQIRCTMIVWATTSRAAWLYGKKHIHEFPVMREYEYFRLSLKSSYYIASREEAKVFGYFLSDDRPKGLCPQLEEAYEKDGRTVAELKEEWEKRIEAFDMAFTSMDEMVKDINQFSDQLLDDSKEAKVPWWTNLPVSSKKP